MEVAEMVRRWQAGESTRGLARATGLSRNTVKKYIRAAEACGLARDGPAPTESEIISLVQLNVAGRPRRACPRGACSVPGETRSTGGSPTSCG